MNTYMYKSILLLSALLFSGCFLPNFVKGIPGSGRITTVKIEAMGFTSVHQASVGSVNISLGEEESVSISTDDNLQQYLSATVENGELVIRTNGEESLSPTKGIQIDVKMKSLTAVRLSGVGSITAENVKSPEFSVKSDGVGSLKLTGEVDKLTVKVDGVGSFDSSKLDAKNVTVESNGVGSTKVRATESLDVKATGVGSVTYFGKPKDKKINASGIGSVSAAE